MASFQDHRTCALAVFFVALFLFGAAERDEKKKSSVDVDLQQLAVNIQPTVENYIKALQDHDRNGAHAKALRHLFNNAESYTPAQKDRLRSTLPEYIANRLDIADFDIHRAGACAVWIKAALQDPPSKCIEVPCKSLGQFANDADKLLEQCKEVPQGLRSPPLSEENKQLLKMLLAQPVTQEIFITALKSYLENLKMQNVGSVELKKFGFETQDDFINGFKSSLAQPTTQGDFLNALKSYLRNQNDFNRCYQFIDGFKRYLVTQYVDMKPATTGKPTSSANPWLKQASDEGDRIDDPESSFLEKQNDDKDTTFADKSKLVSGNGKDSQSFMEQDDFINAPKSSYLEKQNDDKNGQHSQPMKQENKKKAKTSKLKDQDDFINAPKSSYLEKQKNDKNGQHSQPMKQELTSKGFLKILSGRKKLDKKSQPTGQEVGQSKVGTGGGAQGQASWSRPEA